MKMSTKYILLGVLCGVIIGILLIYATNSEKFRVKNYKVNMMATSNGDNVTKSEVVDTDVVDRVDISHAYQQLDNEEYKIYPGNIFLLCMLGDKLHFEYVAEQIYYADNEMEKITGEHDISNLSGMILELEIHKSCKITLDNKNVNIEQFIERWSHLREERIESVMNMSDYILEFKVEEKKIIELSINSN